MNPRIENASARDVYDCIIVSCGYEERSRAMAERLVLAEGAKIAYGYGVHEQLAFADNEKFLLSRGFDFFRVNDADFFGDLQSRLGALRGLPGRPTVLVDISCFTRYRLACLIRCFSEFDNLDVDFFYSLAEFVPPSSDDTISEHVGPATEYFSGWSGEYTNATVVISGLGYEYMKALGVIELVDPLASWLFLPSSSIPQYEAAVRDANILLLRDVDASRVINYNVEDASSLVRDLFSLVAHLRSRYRCVLIPLGPKIFAFSAMLAGAYFRDISVWRVSSGSFSTPVNRKASDLHTMFRVVFNQRMT